MVGYLCLHYEEESQPHLTFDYSECLQLLLVLLSTLPELQRVAKYDYITRRSVLIIYVKVVACFNFITFILVSNV